MISRISPLDEIEARHIEAALAWLDSGADLCRVAKPATPDPHLVSYFVLVDQDHLLLVDHVNAGLWLPTGGHVEPNEDPRDTVVREVFEELGLEAAFLHPDPVFVTVTRTVGRTAGHTDMSLWFVLRGRRGDDLDVDTSEFRSVRWFHLAEIPQDRTDPHLARFVQKLARLHPAYLHPA